MWQSASKSNPLLQRILATVRAAEQYEDLDLQEHARTAIPIERLHAEAREYAEQHHTDFQEGLMKSLLRWYKSEYFSWVNAPSCDRCHGATESRGHTPPTADEAEGGATRVEAYECGVCRAAVRFPRYNRCRTLMATRRGRCGEWANLFCLFCRAVGVETRYVLDLTDHVWVEVYDEARHRWVHCDCCEGPDAYDTPLLYETGWGKRLTYVFAFGRCEVVDVTRRYTARYDELLQRRTECDENRLWCFLEDLNEQRLAGLPAEVRDDVRERQQREQCALLSGGSSPQIQTASASVPVERQSGDLSWRVARGEASAANP